MWFRRKLLSHKVERLLRDKEFKLFTPDVALCSELLVVLNEKHFDHYTPSIGMGVELKLLHPNLEEFLANLEGLVTKMTLGKPISHDMVKPDRTVCTLDNYLTTTDGCYISIKAAVVGFKETSTKLIKALEGSAHKEHNLRMLTHVFADVQLLLRNFLTIAYS